MGARLGLGLRRLVLRSCARLPTTSRSHTTAWSDKVARVLAAAFIAVWLLGLRWLHFHHRAARRSQREQDDGRTI